MAASPTGTPWLKRYHQSVPGATRLICFPHAGGSASTFLALSQALSPAVEVLAVQYPGRQERLNEEPATDLYALLDQAWPEVRRWCDQPFALFGHSMGATLAFEMAGRLERAGIEPQVTFVSGRRAPSRAVPTEIYLQDDDALVAEIKRLNGTDDDVFASDELVRMLLPTIRADYQAIETYRHRPQPPLTGPMVALAGDADPDTTVDDVDAWRESTTGPFDLATFPGGHFFLDTNNDAVTKLLTTHLPPAPGRAPGWA